MANKLVNKRDVDFVLHEQIGIMELTKKELYSQYSKDEFDMVVEQAVKFAENELEPCNIDGDRTGASWKDGKVTLPQSFYNPIRMFGEQGWVAACEDPELGGQGLPYAVFTACNEIFHAGNTALNLYPGLAHGTFTMINKYGTEAQKKKYLDKLLNYEWAGTMNLTEPGAGSSLAHIQTKAEKIDDVHYKIKGQKIFITGGDHDAQPNIINPVLARIEGDPPGIKGISIFLVPKYHVHDDGTIGEANDITCAGIEHKMGIRGSATCQMSYGDNDNCTGEILGKPGQGLQIMFLIMNEERLNVGIQSVGLASASYLNALQYAKERLQGVDLRKKGSSNEQVAIINHPDIRRNLMDMKSRLEGIRALNYYTGYLLDLEKAENDEETKKDCFNMVEFFTPLCKAYSSEVASGICSNAINVFGGYGYCQDYPVEQYFRDQKITALYEGTNAIHANDLLTRKMKLGKGKVLRDVLKEIDSAVKSASEIDELESLAELVDRGAKQFEATAALLVEQLSGENAMDAFQNALPMLMLTGDVITGWMHLWQCTVAYRKLEEIFKKRQAVTRDEKDRVTDDDLEASFYQGKILSSTYYIQEVMNTIESRGKIIMESHNAPLQVHENSF